MSDTSIKPNLIIRRRGIVDRKIVICGSSQKTQRFHRTSGDGWAYARFYNSETERRAALPSLLHFYNHHRGHTSLKGKSPIDLVPNVPGQNT